MPFYLFLPKPPKMKKTSCLNCPTSTCYIKKYCPENWLSVVDERKSQSVYQANQIVIYEGNPVQGIHFILDGKVKVYFTGNNEKSQIVRFANDGHLLGHKGLGQNDFYPLSASTMSKSVICHITNDTLTQLFQANNDFVIGLMGFYSRELRKAEERIKNLTQMSVKEKIVEALLMLCQNFGLNPHNEIDVVFSREDLAATSGSSVPQVASCLTELERDELIERRGKHVIAILNLSGLKKLVEDYNLHMGIL